MTLLLLHVIGIKLKNTTISLLQDIQKCMEQTLDLRAIAQLLTIAGGLELTTLVYRNCDQNQLNSEHLKHCAIELTIIRDNAYQNAFVLGAIMHYLFIQLSKLQQFG